MAPRLLGKGLSGWNGYPRLRFDFMPLAYPYPQVCILEISKFVYQMNNRLPELSSPHLSLQARVGSCTGTERSQAV